MEKDDSNPVKNFDNLYLGMKIENFDEAVDVTLLNKISRLFEDFEK